MTLLTDNRTDCDVSEFINTLEAVARESLAFEGFDEKCEISLSIVNNREIHSINKQFRHIDRETDVLSFPQLTFEKDEVPEKNEKGEIILGDIIISIEKAKSQAEEYGHSLKRELAFLTAHSMLHLLGYDHMTDSEAKVMFEKQEKILNNLGITRG
ncbi:MAG: rRNA maturation RNase YbeY [Clostridia bacterium]|jgi:probable rRNA maturation factor|nr:rRNA maturation RNase YbeY [Clostridia bacterium]